jgi:hypothetical protein
VEVYRRESEEILRRYRAGVYGLPECLAALDAAYESASLFVQPEQHSALTSLNRSQRRALTEESTPGEF